MEEKIEKLPYVLLSIANNIYAVSCEKVISTSILKDIVNIPKAPKEIRGVIRFRDQIIPLVDIRSIFNFKSIDAEIKEFYDLMEARRQDHINWLTTLENCVKEKVKFTLTTDPHACAFGKWYDTYDSSSSNLMFILTFARFDLPHKNIHAIGTKVNELILQNNFEEAQKIIDATKDTELKQMMHLFDDMKDAFKESKREISIILGDDERSICVSADEIVSIEHLTPAEETWVETTMINTKYIEGIYKRNDGTPVFLLNDNLLVDNFSNRVD